MRLEMNASDSLVQKLKSSGNSDVRETAIYSTELSLPPDPHISLDKGLEEAAKWGQNASLGAMTPGSRV